MTGGLDRTPPDRMGFDVKALRATLVVALAMLVATLPAWPAAAEARSTTFASPSAGDVLSRPVPIEVSMTWSGERPAHVDVRLVGSDGARLPDTEVLRLTDCSGSCDDVALREQQATWSGATFDPVTLAPFASGGPRCNGAYGMQVRPQGADWGGGIGVVVSTNPSAPGDVAGSATGGQVEITWRRAPQPDITGYTVQRRPEGEGSWTTVTEVGASTTTATDPDAPVGATEYRVATFRGDGFDDGAAVAACSDSQRDLVAAATPVTVQVAETSSSDGGSDAPDGGSSTPPDTDESDDPDDGSSTGSNPDSVSDDETTPGETGDGESTSGDGDATSGDGGSTSPQETPQRRAPATSVESGSAPTVSVPSVSSPDRSTPRETESFYGEGEGFSEELDFGALDDGSPESQASGDDVEGAVSLDVPGGLESSGSELALRRVLAPVAGGMVMLGFGLHLRRWTRDALD